MAWQPSYAWHGEWGPWVGAGAWSADNWGYMQGPWAAAVAVQVQRNSQAVQPAPAAAEPGPAPKRRSHPSSGVRPGGARRHRGQRQQRQQQPQVRQGQAQEPDANETGLDRRSRQLSRSLAQLLRHGLQRHGLGPRPDGFLPVAAIVPCLHIDCTNEEILVMIKASRREDGGSRFETASDATDGLLIRAVPRGGADGAAGSCMTGGPPPSGAGTRATGDADRRHRGNEGSDGWRRSERFDRGSDGRDQAQLDRRKVSKALARLLRRRSSGESHGELELRPDGYVLLDVVISQLPGVTARDVAKVVQWSRRRQGDHRFEIDRCSEGDIIRATTRNRQRSRSHTPSPRHHRSPSPQTPLVPVADRGDTGSSDGTEWSSPGGAGAAEAARAEGQPLEGGVGSWSPRTHVLFPLLARDIVVGALRTGYLLHKAVGFPKQQIKALIAFLADPLCGSAVADGEAPPYGFARLPPGGDEELVRFLAASSAWLSARRQPPTFVEIRRFLEGGYAAEEATEDLGGDLPPDARQERAECLQLISAQRDALGTAAAKGDVCRFRESGGAEAGRELETAVGEWYNVRLPDFVRGALLGLAGAEHAAFCRNPSWRYIWKFYHMGQTCF